MCYHFEKVIELLLIIHAEKYFDYLKLRSKLYKFFRSRILLWFYLNNCILIQDWFVQTLEKFLTNAAKIFTLFLCFPTILTFSNKIHQFCRIISYVSGLPKPFKYNFTVNVKDTNSVLSCQGRMRTLKRIVAKYMIRNSEIEINIRTRFYAYLHSTE